ncbi:MAG: 7-carboxy-7-deazaguanine synthase QueE [Crocinitomicaceae bacterium]|nr:7-carboxy-7-deazaguanine synthase QueE [Crocinitomicaceae bacterium]
MSEKQKLPIMEMFYSLQGEGFHSGKPAFFIRLAGCDVGCVWCDVKESWNAGDHEELSIDHIISEVEKAKADFVVITGGEPAMYDLNNLTNQLHNIGCYIAIETSGAYELNGTFDWVCLSPKKFKPPTISNYKLAQELKVIVLNKHDLSWCEEQRSLVKNKDCKFFLQPEWDKQEIMLPLIIDYVKSNTMWQVSLQTHKYMNIP